MCPRTDQNVVSTTTKAKHNAGKLMKFLTATEIVQNQGFYTGFPYECLLYYFSILNRETSKTALGDDYGYFVV